MKSRQLKKILDTYLLDTEEDLMIPPSVYRVEEREMNVYYSKAWRISNPEKAEEMDKAIEKALQEAHACGCGCECGEHCDCEDEDHCNCGDDCKCKDK